MMAQTQQAGTPDSAVYTDPLGRTLRSRTRDFADELIFQDVQYDERGLKTRESTPYKQYGSPAYTTIYQLRRNGPCPQQNRTTN
jgi:hypothetical protein